MTKVDVLIDHGKIVSIEIKDHAGFDLNGKDVVCAGISAAAIGALNAVDKLCTNEAVLGMKPGKIFIKADHPGSRLETCLEFLLIQLETIRESYPGYIRITRKEV